MPTRKRQVKRKTSLGKVAPSRRRHGRLKPTESPARGSAQDTGDVTLVPSPSGDQQRSVVHTARKRAGLRGEEKAMFVPVVDRNQNPLMPTTSARARKWIRSGKATPFWKRGVFCVRLNVDPSDNKTQPIAVGIDPGSKREAFTVKSKKHTYLNVLTEAVTWVKGAMKRRRDARGARRQRNTPCRPCRQNRGKGVTPPSTMARWDWKIRIITWIRKMFDVGSFIVEEVKAKTRGKKWNASFSPLKIGKKWFYDELLKLGSLTIRKGWETKLMRDELGLKKSGSKLADRFECHNVDSWVLARSAVGGPESPDNTSLIKLVPLQFRRRQIHRLQPGRGGVRSNYGGTRSLGFTRGSLVRHAKYGLCYVGGAMLGRASLHDPFTGKRITQEARLGTFRFLTYSSWRAVLHSRKSL